MKGILEKSHADSADGGNDSNSSDALSSQSAIGIGAAGGCVRLCALCGVLDQGDWTVGRCCILGGTSHCYH